MSLLGSLSQFVPGMGTNTKPTAQNIVSDVAGYQSKIGKYGLGRTTLGLAVINHPKTLDNLANGATHRETNEFILPVYCDTFSLPGVSLSSSDVRMHGYGITEKRPTGSIFIDVNLSFVGDGEGQIHKYFYNWMNSIVRFDQSSHLRDRNNNMRYDVSYKEDYAVQIGLFVYNETNDQITQIVLNEAWPIFMGDVQMNWADSHNLQRIPITFTYRGWNYLDDNVNRTGSGIPEEGILSKAMKTLNAVKTLSTIRKPQNIGDMLNIVSNGAAIASGFGLLK